MASRDVCSRSAVCLTLSIMVGLPAPVAAEDRPHVAVEIHRVPALQRNVLAGDFNGDGHVDLVGGAAMPPWTPATLHIAFGTGTGTFGPATPLGIQGEPAAVADINDNGQLDLVVRQTDGVVVLPGRGDGTFQAARPLHSEMWTAGDPYPYHFALVADFSGNGHLDIAIPSYERTTAGVLIFPGNGDFTFGVPTLLPRPAGPVDGVTADFTGNGRPDLAVTDACCDVAIFRNDGGMLFVQSQIAMAGDLTGIAAGDLDGDGRIDLVVGEFFDWENVQTDGHDTSGRVAVLLGNGNGTFQDASRYNSGVRGEAFVVLGDFTYDGIVDVASGNRSYFRHDDAGIQKWDSVTIFRGTGSGTLEAPVTFALDDAGVLYDQSPYAATMRKLIAVDIDGDGRPDLVSSPAAILLTRPAPSRNTPPTVFAGHDRTVYSEDPLVLHAQAHDPDHHWLTYEWLDSQGHRIATWPIAAPTGFISGLEPGVYTFTANVEDAHGGAASDSVTIISVDHHMRSGWTAQDIGATSPPGQGSYDFPTGTFTVSGAGADIWDPADAFHYLSQPIIGNFRIQARVASLEHVHRWTKAGLMIRESLAPGSRHASVFATPTTERPVAFQRRTTTGGPSVHTGGAFVGPPVWIALTRIGDEITAQYRLGEAGDWITIGTETIVQLQTWVNVGLAVTSHHNGRLATATFDGVFIELMPEPAFSSRDIGVVSAQGASTMHDGRAVVSGSGADIWSTADAFHYLYQQFGGDFQVVVRADSVDAVHRWTKAGLMIRETLQPGSRHASIFATPTTERPVAFQRRRVANGESVHTDGAFVAPPVWLSLSRVGDRITAHYRLSSSPAWVLVGSETLPGLPHSVLVGLAVTSHADGALATARFEDYRVRRIDEPEGPGFTSEDIGAVSAAGNSSIEGGVFTVRGSGADIWGTADAFHYLHRPMTGDFQIAVRVTSVEDVHRWTKGGLMVRETLDPGARHASIFATPTTERPVAFQRRPTAHGESMHTDGAFAGPPVWLALSRTGDRITAHYRLAAAGEWIEAGSQTLTGLAAQVYVGLAVTSHRDGVLAAATFDTMQLAGGH